MNILTTRYGQWFYDYATLMLQKLNKPFQPLLDYMRNGKGR